MKINVNPSEIQKVLGRLAKVIPLKTSYPMLQTYHFEVRKGNLVITASDGSITTRAGLHLTGCDDASGSFCLDNIQAVNIFRSLDFDCVALDVSDSLCRFSWENGTAELPVFNASDYPSAPKIPKDGFKADIRSKDFVQAVNAVYDGISDNDEAHPAMMSMALNFSEKGLDVVGTDSHLLICCTLSGSYPAQRNLMVPKKTAKLLRDTLPTGVEDVLTISADDRNVKFVTGSSAIITPQTLGRYPNYRAVIPSSGSNILTIARETLRDSANRIAVCSDKAVPTIRMNVRSSGRISIIAQDLSLSSKASEDIEGNYAGTEMNIGFSSKYLSRALGSFGDGNMSLSFGDNPRKAVLLTSESTPGVRTVLMPTLIES